MFQTYIWNRLLYYRNWFSLSPERVTYWHYSVAGGDDKIIFHFKEYVWNLTSRKWKLDEDKRWELELQVWGESPSFRPFEVAVCLSISHQAGNPSRLRKHVCSSLSAMLRPGQVLIGCIKTLFCIGGEMTYFYISVPFLIFPWIWFSLRSVLTQSWRRKSGLL